MHNTQFDPFGGPVAHNLDDMFAKVAQQRSGSRLLLRSGIGMFWALVIGIVAVRVAYSDPDFVQELENLAALSKCLHTVFA